MIFAAGRFICRPGQMSGCVLTRHDLRPSTRARLEMTLSGQVLPRFGTTPLVKITNAEVPRWVADLLGRGLAPSTVRKAVLALRQCLSAAVADGRLLMNPALDVPLGLSGLSRHGSCHRTRSSCWLRRCLIATGHLSWSARTPGCAGERMRA